MPVIRSLLKEGPWPRFFEELKEQRWDDHRFYHHSRINQTLHLISACSFLVTYVLLFTHPVVGGAVRLDVRDVHPPGRPLLLRAQGLRRDQPGDPRVQGGGQGRLQPAPQGDPALDLGARAAGALRLSRRCSACSRRPGPTSAATCEHLSRLWIGLAAGALLFRTVHLFFLRDVQTGLVWFTKILTDPFHDIMLYHKAPLVPAARRADRAREAARVAAGSRGRRGASRKRCTSISRRMRRLIALLVSAASAHQKPSSLHRPRRGDEAVGDRVEVGVAVVEAEDEAAGADPAQRQALGAQVVLQHPVVAGRAACTRPSRSTTGWRPAPAGPRRAGAG